jgi:carboxyl-terminal processing protease
VVVFLRTCSAALIPLILASGSPTLTAAQKTANLASFELVWKTLRDGYWDPSMGGVDWNAAHEQYRREVEQAETVMEARLAMERMLHLLPSSHLAIIPGSLYKPLPNENRGTQKRDIAKAENPDDSPDKEDETGLTGITVGVIDREIVVEAVDSQSSAGKQGVRAGWIIKVLDGMPAELLFADLNAENPPTALLVSRLAENWLNGTPGSRATVVFKTAGGKLTTVHLKREAERAKAVRFGNLPPEHVKVEHKMLENGVGYIRLNLFMDPVRVMAEIEKAIADFRTAPGIVLDLRNNPGGIGVMAMGIAGWFVTEEGTRLGTMTSRDSTLNFVINPRAEPYRGRLAIVVNEGSASTSEILAQGLRDLGRARIFGTRTAGAALPSSIIELPDGDRFQYPEANYVSMNGRVLEGHGVEPDEVVAPTLAALLAGRDLPLEAAQNWCRGK